MEQLKELFTNIKICLFLNLVWNTRLETILNMTNLEALSLLGVAGKTVLAFQQAEKHLSTDLHVPTRSPKRLLALEHSWKVAMNKGMGCEMIH